MKHALAAVFTGAPGSLELQEIPLPALGAEEILVRVLGCTICGSDLHSFEGRRSVPTPTILGHEIVGEIVELGPAAPRVDFAGKPLRLGDRVAWAIVAHCGACAMCEYGLPQKCLRAVKYGHEAFRPGRELLGGLAEYCLLVPGASIFRLPDALPLEVACPASCATATIIAALEAAGDLRGRNVAVLGAGMLGLSACAMLAAQGAKNIVCIDPAPLRRDRARAFGASHAAPPDEMASAARTCCGEGGFDAVLELSGSAQAFETAWPLVRTGGVMVLVGSVFPGPPVGIQLEQIVRRQLTLRGVHNYAPQHLEMALAFLEAHHARFPFAELVAEWLPLRRAAEAFEKSRSADVIRIGLRP